MIISGRNYLQVLARGTLQMATPWKLTAFCNK